MPFHSVLMLAATGVVLAFVVIVVGVAWLRGRGIVNSGARTIRFQVWGPALAAACSVGAATIHATVIPAHVAQYPPTGLFFGALVAFQLAWAVGFVRRSSEWTTVH